LKPNFGMAWFPSDSTRRKSGSVFLLFEALSLSLKDLLPQIAVDLNGLRADDVPGRRVDSRQLDAGDSIRRRGTRASVQAEETESPSKPKAAVASAQPQHHNHSFTTTPQPLQHNHHTLLTSNDALNTMVANVFIF
jgi:hypothetical protein